MLADGGYNMKIMINGILRDMTEEEIKELEEIQLEHDEQERKRLLLN